MSTLQRETAPKDGFLPSLLPQHENAAGDYVATGENNPLPVLIQLIKGMMPVQFQETLRTQTPIQTHNASIIPANNWTSGTWIPASGFDRVAVNVNMTSGTGMAVKLDVSFDGVNQSFEKVILDSSGSTLTDEYPITAPFIRLSIKNKDTGAVKTTSAYVYLKS